jgi:hypothetical protein
MTGAQYNLHLVSDGTGETLCSVAKAVCSQFAGVAAREYVHCLVRGPSQLQRIIERISENQGIVFFMLHDHSTRTVLERECSSLGLPCISVLDKPIETIGNFLTAATARRWSDEEHEGERARIVAGRKGHGVAAPACLHLRLVSDNPCLEPKYHHGKATPRPSTHLRLCGR